VIRPSTAPSTLLLRGGSLLNTVPGLGPALLSPAASAIGFIFWDKNWRGSAFSLNFVKNVIVSFFFAGALIWTGTIPSFGAGDAANVAFWPLVLSALCGVVIGDCTAIGSLKRLGSRRYLLIDCLKPALAALFGVVVLNERVTLRLAGSITAVVGGVYIASTAKLENEEDGVVQASAYSIGIGYLLAVLHLLLDTAGAALTKKVCGGLQPFQIGLIRFGSSAIMLAAIGGTAALWSRALVALSNAAKEGSSPESKIEKTRRWYEMPTDMSKDNWRAIAIGTFFVTFTGPSLFYISLSKMPLAVVTTLSCLGPVYEPFLSKAMRGTPIEPKAVLGAAIAFLGVASLYM